MGKKVFIMSIPRESATGLDKARNDSSGALILKNKVGRANTKVMALYSPSKGGLNNYISYTPWIDPETNLPTKDSNGNVVMLQDYLEKKYGKEKGYYTNKPVTKDQKPEEATFFQSTYWILNDGTTMLDLDYEYDEIGYYMMLGSSLVANSEREYKEHKWPRAEFYIAIENESDELKYKRNELKVKAFAILDNSIFTEGYRRKFAVLLGVTSTKAVKAATIEQVNNLIYDYIDRSTTTEHSNVSKLLNLFSQLKTAQGKESIEAKYLLQEAIDLRVVYEKQGTYTWVRPTGNIVLGDRYEDAIDFLTNPKKSAELDEIKEAIKNKN